MLKRECLINIFICVVFFASCKGVNPMANFITKASERYVEVGKVETINTEGTQIKFDLSENRRGWTWYISGQEEFVRLNNHPVKVNIIIRNTGENAFHLNVRELDENKVKTFLLQEGDEKLVYSGDLYEFLLEMHKNSRLKPLSDERFTEWRPVLSTRSAVQMGSEISGEMIISPESIIKLPSPIIIYTYIPPDTL